jgi:hypothetical protein
MKTLQHLWLFLFFIPLNFVGQKIDNLVSFRDIKSSKYIRLNYENDVFTHTDLDYTQGCNIELVLPWLSKNPFNHLFFLPKKNEFKFGISLESIGFTADSLESYKIQYGNRPFASALMLKSFLIATDTIHRSRITSSLSLGIIGPGSGGGKMQREFHKMIGSATPNGWYYQIKNDIVINYEISYEKQLFRFHDFFSLNSNSTLKLGTLFTNASIGLNATLGIINSPFTSIKNNNKFQLYLFSQPILSVIGYDATLQGGLFNRKSVYTISSSDIERFTLQNNFGIVFQYDRFYFEYTRTLLTHEISTANAHNWGGIRLGYKL